MDNRRYGFPTATVLADGVYVWNALVTNQVRTLRKLVAADVAAALEAQPGVLAAVFLANPGPATGQVRVQAWDKNVVDNIGTPAGNPVFDLTIQISNPAVGPGGADESASRINARFTNGMVLKVTGLDANGAVLTVSFGCKGKRRFGAIDNFSGTSKLLQ